MSKSPLNINAQAMADTSEKMEVSASSGTSNIFSSTNPNGPKFNFGFSNALDMEIPIPANPTPKLSLFEQSLTAAEKEELKKQLAGNNNPLLTKLYIAANHAEDNIKELQNNLFRVELQKKELQFAYDQSKEKITSVFSKIKEALICPICKEPAVLPKIVAKCGHSVCEECIKQIDENAFNDLTNRQNTGNTSAYQHLQNRRCPLCRSKMIGSGLPNLTLKEIACVSVDAGLIEFEEPHLQTAFKKKFADNSIQFEKQTPEAMLVEALEHTGYASSQLAELCALKILNDTNIPRHDWINGIYVLFDSSTSQTFFEIFARYLHGKTHSNKPGEIQVLVNGSKRILAVQLIATEKADVELSNHKKPHTLIKIEGATGRYVTTAVQENSADPNSRLSAVLMQPLAAPIPEPVPVATPARALVPVATPVPVAVPPAATRAVLSASPAAAAAAVRVAAVYAAAARASAAPRNVALIPQTGGNSAGTARTLAAAANPSLAAATNRPTPKTNNSTPRASGK